MHLGRSIVCYTGAYHLSTRPSQTPPPPKGGVRPRSVCGGPVRGRGGGGAPRFRRGVPPLWGMLRVSRKPPPPPRLHRTYDELTKADSTETKSQFRNLHKHFPHFMASLNQSQSPRNYRKSSPPVSQYVYCMRSSAPGRLMPGKAPLVAPFGPPRSKSPPSAAAIMAPPTTTTSTPSAPWPHAAWQQEPQDAGIPLHASPLGPADVAPTNTPAPEPVPSPSPLTGGFIKKRTASSSAPNRSVSLPAAAVASATSTGPPVATAAPSSDPVAPFLPAAVHSTDKVRQLRDSVSKQQKIADRAEDLRRCGMRTCVRQPRCPPVRDAFEGKAPQRQPQKPWDGRLEGIAEAVGGGYCRL